MLRSLLLAIVAVMVCLSIRQECHALESLSCSKVFLIKKQSLLSKWLDVASRARGTRVFDDENWEQSMQSLGLENDPHRPIYRFLFQLRLSHPRWISIAAFAPQEAQRLSVADEEKEQTRNSLRRMALGASDLHELIMISRNWTLNDVAFAEEFFLPFWVRNFFAELISKQNLSSIESEVDLLLDLRIPAVDRKIATLLGSEIAIRHPNWLHQLLDPNRKSSQFYLQEAEVWKHGDSKFKTPGEISKESRAQFTANETGVHQQVLELAIESIAANPQWGWAYPRLVKWLVNSSAQPKQAIMILVGLSKEQVSDSEILRNYGIFRSVKIEELQDSKRLRELVSLGTHDLEVIQVAVRNKIELPNDIILELFDHQDPVVLTELYSYVDQYLDHVSPEVIGAYLAKAKRISQQSEAIILTRSDASRNLIWYQMIAKKEPLEVTNERLQYLIRYSLESFDGDKKEELPIRTRLLSREGSELLYRGVLLNPGSKTNPHLLIAMTENKKLDRKQLLEVLKISRWRQDKTLQDYCRGKINPACFGYRNILWSFVPFVD